MAMQNIIFIFEATFVKILRREVASGCYIQYSRRTHRGVLVGTEVAIAHARQ